ncbi:LacI family DNA-binding transcriptional regulator [Paenibacillus xylaniclasticus]|uniref:LacI family DNA-binding transcriptional regulator n=1 Tax=Paenibacillus xylaniclasticus TaxID=588083 RepID=UPI000FD8B222|nr:MULTISPECIES: LacI family DNA-binding transcriptional regulator [Paenibacillus]GFN33451.1 LacI family transcriptional regulator [Paenibacillus curdlanolyticus]
MTLKQIANMAGVSISTVSRILNSPDNSFATKEVRDKVWRFAREIGYVPNQNARELKLGKRISRKSSPPSISCILGRTRQLDDDPFFAQMSRAIEQQALDLGYAVRHSYSLFDIETDTLLDQIEASHTDGAIILGRFSNDSMSFLEKHYKSLVYVGRNFISASCDQVICDGYEATQIAMMHLIEHGHQRIGYIGETKNEVRYEAYCDIIRKYGLEYSEKWVSNCPQNGPGGYQGADALLAKASTLPTAVFCATDIAAIAALRRFSEAKIKVPEQLSIISMDNIELSGYVSPMLTTVGMPIIEMGNWAVQLLINRLSKRHQLPAKVLLPNKLIIRESVAARN